MTFIAKKIVIKKPGKKRITKSTTGYTLDEIKASVSSRNIEIVGNEFIGGPKWHHIPTGRTAKLNDADLSGYMKVIAQMKEKMMEWRKASESSKTDPVAKAEPRTFRQPLIKMSAVLFHDCPLKKPLYC